MAAPTPLSVTSTTHLSIEEAFGLCITLLHILDVLLEVHSVHEGDAVIVHHAAGQGEWLSTGLEHQIVTVDHMVEWLGHWTRD